MNRDHDRVALTSTERDLFTRIEQELAFTDPGFALSLQPTWRRMWASGWSAGVLLVVGAIAMLVSVGRSLPAALAGALVFAMGMGVGVRRVARRRLSSKNTSP